VKKEANVSTMAKISAKKRHGDEAEFDLRPAGLIAAKAFRQSHSHLGHRRPPAVRSCPVVHARRI